MLTVNEAIASLLKDGKRLVESERVDVLASLGRTQDQDVIAPIDVPPADNSAMDGYAFRHAEWPGADQEIPLSQRITAGSVPTSLEPGTAARIFTGA